MGEADNGGSHPWPWSTKGDDWTPWPISRVIGLTALSELIGHTCRFVRLTDHVTEDIVPGRVTILLDDQDRIIEIYKDPNFP